MLGNSTGVRISEKKSFGGMSHGSINQTSHTPRRTHTHTQTHTHPDAHTPRRTHPDAHTQTHRHTHTHTQTHTHTHTHKHTHTQSAWMIFIGVFQDFSIICICPVCV